jgi:hypothetical protein
MTLTQTSRSLLLTIDGASSRYAIDGVYPPSDDNPRVWYLSKSLSQAHDPDKVVLKWCLPGEAEWLKKRAGGCEFCGLLLPYVFPNIQIGAVGAYAHDHPDREPVVMEWMCADTGWVKSDEAYQKGLWEAYLWGMGRFVELQSHLKSQHHNKIFGDLKEVPENWFTRADGLSRVAVVDWEETTLVEANDFNINRLIGYVSQWLKVVPRALVDPAAYDKPTRLDTLASSLLEAAYTVPEKLVSRFDAIRGGPTDARFALPCTALDSATRLWVRLSDDEDVPGAYRAILRDEGIRQLVFSPELIAHAVINPSLANTDHHWGLWSVLRLLKPAAPSPYRRRLEEILPMLASTPEMTLPWEAALRVVKTLYQDIRAKPDGWDEELLRLADLEGSLDTAMRSYTSGALDPRRREERPSAGQPKPRRNEGYCLAERRLVAVKIWLPEARKIAQSRVDNLKTIADRMAQLSGDAPQGCRPEDGRAYQRVRKEIFRGLSSATATNCLRQWLFPAEAAPSVPALDQQGLKSVVCDAIHYPALLKLGVLDPEVLYRSVETLPSPKRTAPEVVRKEQPTGAGKVNPTPPSPPEPQVFLIPNLGAGTDMNDPEQVLMTSIQRTVAQDKFQAFFKGLGDQIVNAVIPGQSRVPSDELRAEVWFFAAIHRLGGQDKSDIRKIVDDVVGRCKGRLEPGSVAGGFTEEWYTLLAPLFQLKGEPWAGPVRREPKVPEGTEDLGLRRDQLLKTLHKESTPHDIAAAMRDYRYAFNQMLTSHQSVLQQIERVSSEQHTDFDTHARILLDAITQLTGGPGSQSQVSATPQSMVQDSPTRKRELVAQASVTPGEGHVLESAPELGKTSSDIPSPSPKSCVLHANALTEIRQNLRSEGSYLVALVAKHVVEEANLEHWEHMRCLSTCLVAEKCPDHRSLPTWVNAFHLGLAQIIVGEATHWVQVCELTLKTEQCECPIYLYYPTFPISNGWQPD